ncbi:helix-hairpin-helix domain-containing protein [Prevotella sp.]
MNLKSIFYLHRSDRKVFLVLLFFIAICFGFIIIVGNDTTTTADATNDSVKVQKRSSFSNKEQLPEVITAEGKHLFTFDPNTASAEQLQQLGLAPYQVRNIIKYRSKGGIYRSPMDFARLYGLTRKQYRELEPYITIDDDYEPASTLASVQAYIAKKEADKQAAHAAYEAYKMQNTYKPYKGNDRDTLRYPLKLKIGEHINLAMADTTQLKKVPGIGSGWARAIVNYSKRLGGYVTVGQLQEIEGFPEEALPYFSITNPQTEKINLNTATLAQLRKHPYMNFYQAKAICDYRRLKGKLTNLSQLRLLKDFTSEAIERLRPYVEF